MILPGHTIGLLGGGSIGRMLAGAAQALGYRVHVFDPAAACPAGAMANQEITASYDDLPALKEFARNVDLITCTFEGVSVDPLNAIAPLVPLIPRVDVLQICQNRQREKVWLRLHGFPQVRFAEALDGDIRGVISQVGRPCLVKSADFAYDGRGQMKIVSDVDLEKADAIFRGRRCILERWVDFSCEVCVIVARCRTGVVKAFPLAETIHKRHVLDLSIVPARVSPAIAREATQLAIATAEKLGVVGLLAVEMFVTPGGEVLINELAPRPHHAGNWSLDTCETSQFEQHVRAICELPLGAVEVREPTVTVNLPADWWESPRDGVPGAPARHHPNWSALLAAPRTKLHLYGEAELRAGWKMGHFTLWDAEIERAMERAKALRDRL